MPLKKKTKFVAVSSLFNLNVQDVISYVQNLQKHINNQNKRINKLKLKLRKMVRNQSHFYIAGWYEMTFALL